MTRHSYVDAYRRLLRRRRVTLAELIQAHTRDPKRAWPAVPAQRKPLSQLIKERA